MIVIIPLQNSTPTRQGLLGMCLSCTELPAHWTPPHFLLTSFFLSPPLRLQGLQIIRSDSEAGEVEELHFSADLTFHKAPHLRLQHGSWESNSYTSGKAALIICKVSGNELLGVRMISRKKPNAE